MNEEGSPADAGDGMPDWCWKALRVALRRMRSMVFCVEPKMEDRTSGNFVHKRRNANLTVYGDGSVVAAHLEQIK